MGIESIKCESIVYEPSYDYSYKDNKTSLKHLEQCRPCVKESMSKYQISYKVREKTYQVRDVWEVVE